MEDEVLRRVYLTEDVEAIWMNQITVDGISSRNTRKHGYQFFTLKRDTWPEEIHMETNGFLDDSEGAEEAYWDSPHVPVSYSLGDIDEEAWLKYGDILGKDE